MPDRRIVYSTDPDFPKRCPRCGSDPCRCAKPETLPPRQQVARIQREKKGRGGKTVTVVSGLQMAPDDLKALGKRLKTACGCGGTVKEGNIEIQGDQRDRIAAELRQMGYKVKLVGG